MQPFHGNDIPDELAGLEFANQASRTITGENKWVAPGIMTLCILMAS